MRALQQGEEPAAEALEMGRRRFSQRSVARLYLCAAGAPLLVGEAAALVSGTFAHLSDTRTGFRTASGRLFFSSSTSRNLDFIFGSPEQSR